MLHGFGTPFQWTENMLELRDVGNLSFSVATVGKLSGKPAHKCKRAFELICIMLMGQ